MVENEAIDRTPGARAAHTEEAGGTAGCARPARTAASASRRAAVSESCRSTRGWCRSPSIPSTHGSRSTSARCSSACRAAACRTILTQTFLRYARAAGVNTRNRITPHTLRMSTRPSYRTAGRTCARSRSSSGTSTWTRLDTALHARHRARAARCGEAPAVGESFRVTNRAAPPLTSGKKRRRECATSRD